MISQQGKRTDLQVACEILEHKGTMRDVALHDGPLFVKYHKGLYAYKQILQEHRIEKPNVIWLWGPSGCGKTRRATSFNENYYIKDNSKWWEGYNNEPVVIIDDFRLSTWEPGFDYLLRLLDRYKCTVQIKGGSAVFNSSTVFITSDRPPEQFFYGRDYEQIIRRIDILEYLPATIATEVGGNTGANLD